MNKLQPARCASASTIHTLHVLLACQELHMEVHMEGAGASGCACCRSCQHGVCTAGSSVWVNSPQCRAAYCSLTIITTNRHVTKGTAGQYIVMQCDVLTLPLCSLGQRGPLLIWQHLHSADQRAASHRASWLCRLRLAATYQPQRQCKHGYGTGTHLRALM